MICFGERCYSNQYDETITIQDAHGTARFFPLRINILATTFS